MSVADREGVATLARELRALGVDIFATDGTRDLTLADNTRVYYLTGAQHGPARFPSRGMPCARMSRC